MGRGFRGVGTALNRLLVIRSCGLQILTALVEYELVTVQEPTAAEAIVLVKAFRAALEQERAEREGPAAGPDENDDEEGEDDDEDGEVVPTGEETPAAAAPAHFEPGITELSDC